MRVLLSAARRCTWVLRSRIEGVFMHWLLVIIAFVTVSGVAGLAWASKRAADRQRRIWSDEEVRLLQRRARLAVLHPPHDRYPEIWPTKHSL